MAAQEWRDVVGFAGGFNCSQTERPVHRLKVAALVGHKGLQRQKEERPLPIQNNALQRSELADHGLARRRGRAHDQVLAVEHAIIVDRV